MIRMPLAWRLKMFWVNFVAMVECQKRDIFVEQRQKFCGVLFLISMRMTQNWKESGRWKKDMPKNPSSFAFIFSEILSFKRFTISRTF